jgi:two-component system, OmpR family, sensor histidine kinase CpxA
MMGLFIKFIFFPMTGGPFQAFRNITAYHSDFLVEKIGYPPEKNALRDISEKLNFNITIERGNEVFKTDPLLPRIAEVKKNAKFINNEFGKFKGLPFILKSKNGVFYFFQFKKSPFSNIKILRLIIIPLVILLVLIFSIILVKNLLRPLDHLMDGVSHISSGDFDFKVRLAKDAEFKKLGSAFNKMSDKIKQMIEAREQLLRDVSHELRSPLTRTLVAMESIEKNKLTEGLLNDLHEMEQLIGELLENQRLQKKKTFQSEKTDLVLLVQEIINMYPRTIFKTHPLECYAQVDQGKLKTLIKNLIENALKYSKKDIFIYLTLENDEVILKIEDFGIGIPSYEKELIFEPFYRIDKSRNKDTGGYGLGLSLCKKIIILHGGKIEVSSEENKGTIFSVFLPVNNSQRAEFS